MLWPLVYCPLIWRHFKIWWNHNLLCSHQAVIAWALLVCGCPISIIAQTACLFLCCYQRLIFGVSCCFLTSNCWLCYQWIGLHWLPHSNMHRYALWPIWSVQSQQIGGYYVFWSPEWNAGPALCTGDGFLVCIIFTNSDSRRPMSSRHHTSPKPRLASHINTVVFPWLLLPYAYTNTYTLQYSVNKF